LLIYRLVIKGMLDYVGFCEVIFGYDGYILVTSFLEWILKQGSFLEGLTHIDTPPFLWKRELAVNADGVSYYYSNTRRREWNNYR